MATNIHERLMGCITEALGKRDLGQDTNFIEAGMASIGHAKKLLFRLSQVIDTPVSLRDLMDHPTPGELASFLGQDERPRDHGALGDYPLTQAQLGILVESLTSPDSTTYNIPILFELSENVDTERLRRSLDTAIAAHPYFSATLFTTEEHEYRARRNDANPVRTEVIHADALPENLVVPFDVLGGQLLRAQIYVTPGGTYLFIDCYHAISDGESVEFLIRDANAAYAGRDVPVERYSGFEVALDEQELRGTPRHDEDKAYYDGLLGDADLDMLPDRDERGDGASFGAFCMESRLDWAPIRAYLREHCMSSTAFFDAAFAFVLSRFCGRKDALFATVLDGRNESRDLGTVAMMADVIPVLSHAADDEAIDDFVAAIGCQLLESSSHDLYSFGDIAHDHGLAPDIIFGYQGKLLTIGEVAGAPATLHRYLRTIEGTGTSLQVVSYVCDGKLVFECAHRSDRFSETFVRCLVSCLERAVEEFQTRTLLGEVTLLDDETVAALDAFNDTATDYPVMDVVTMFRDSAERHPDRPAVVFKDKTYTYREVDDITERIAVHLRSRGVSRGDVVSILIPRSEYMPITALGTLKAGACYQPLDPSYPTERLAFMMSDANCKVLIADESLLSLVPDYQGPTLLTKDIPNLPTSERITTCPHPEDMFVLLYTSGTTGTPKGVILEHRNICNFCQWAQGYYGIDETSRCSTYASFGFDAHLMDTYPTLTCGACLCVVEEEIRLDLIAMEAWYCRMGITHGLITTQVGRQFYTSCQVPTLRHLTVGGEKLVPLEPIEGPTVLHNAYGPSECTIMCSVQEVDKLYERVPIGLPLANVRLYVVDEHLRRVPPLVPGELLIAGRGVGRGYLGRPDLTEKAFITNPFTDEADYAHVYRTGDVVRQLPDGRYDFVGRHDSQVKVRGFRIELSEVEAVIRDFPGIEDATVAAFEDDQTGEKYLCAYVVSKDKVDIDALNGFIRKRKPPYMVPAHTMQLESIPLNQNQKVNKRALPKPAPEEHEGTVADAPAAPPNVLETELMGIIDEIIHVKSFGVAERLSNLGLTSLSGIRLAVQLHKRFGVDLDARELVSNATLQSVENAILANLLTRKEQVHEAQQEPEQEARQENRRQATGRDRERCCPLSFAQQGVYAECQASPESTRYNIPYLLTFPAGVTATELAAAVRAVVDAHAYVLCRFVHDESGDVVQEPIPDFTLEIPVREMSAQDLEAYKAQFVRPFDLQAGPLVRFEIVQADALFLLVDMHHLVSDGASVDLFFAELCQALDGKAIEPERYSYYDFVADQTLSSEEEDFFASRMSLSSGATELIADVYEEGLSHTQRDVEVSSELARVTEFARKVGVTPAAVYLGATYLALARFVCEDTVTIATISNGRSNLKVSDNMGMFVNTLPLVAAIDGTERCEDYLRRMAQDFSDTIAHETYPFARIASTYDFHPACSFAYQVGVLNDYRCAKGPVGATSLDTDIAKLPIAVFVEGDEDAAHIKVSYDSALYSRDMMDNLAASIENVVQGLLSAETISEISLTGPEQWRVLDSYNKPFDLGFDANDSVASVFRRTAAAHPDKVAAIFGDKRYTYRELDELTDRLAARLYAKCRELTGKESLAEEVAAILVPRDENVFILPLAAIKAGVAYEPLDASYPAERLNFMVRDAGVVLLVADEDLLGHVSEYDGAVLTVRELYAMEDVPVLTAAPAPHDLFIVLYTSGSTGTPKGCQIEHQNVVAYAHGVHDDFYREDDTIAAYASFGFDVNMSDVFCTLLNGGTLCLIDAEVRMNLDSLAAYFDEVGVTALLLTTQVGVQFLENYPKLKTLRMLVMGGEKLPAVDPSRLSYTIVNGYGPTENCCGVSLFPIRAWEPNIPIGKPMATIHGYVLDKCGHRLPAGAAGEYCLVGPQVSRGYLNRPDKTAEAYQQSPFDDFRMYHTGDVVRYRTSGDVEFCGRKDAQVKIRGFRVETTEVESVIRDFPGIRDVTVQAYDADGGGKYLAAFVVSDEKVDIEALAAYIASVKPAYMVPPAIMQIERIPLTVNMKVDKKALPKPERRKAAYVEPAGKVERDLSSIFAEVLGVESVGAEDDFFDLGGSSILAMKVVVLAGKAGYTVVYNDVFSYPTPRSLAAAVAGGGGTDADAAPATEVSAVAASGELPEVGPDGYDYHKIHELLERNTIEAFREGERTPLGDVLLLGATGYLGSHVLHELIEHHEGKIWCLVRAGRGASGEERLKGILRRYFGGDYAGLFGERIHVVEGDATDAASLAGVPTSEGMCAINCAANVKHFAPGNEIEHANVDSVRCLVDWCLETGARLVHISTGSVLGSRLHDMPPVGYKFSEHRLFVGQYVDGNQYCHSKFMAERLVFEAMVEKGLRAKVLRMGNLAPRLADGAFQVNYTTNSYMNTFRALQTLGVVGFDMLDAMLEFSPIDCLAQATLALAETPDVCSCFFPLNPHRALMGDVVACLAEAGYPIRGVEADEFAAALEQTLADEKTREAVSSLVAYQSSDDSQEMGLGDADISHTVRILARLGFSWPETGRTYIRSFIDVLDGLGFFGGSAR